MIALVLARVLLAVFYALARWVLHCCEDYDATLFGPVGPAPISSS